MRRPTSLEKALENLAVVEERIESLQGLLDRLRRSQPEADLGRFERTLALLIESRQLLQSCVDAFRDRWPALAPDRTRAPGAGRRLGDCGDAEISLADPESVRTWCLVFGCSEADLIQAVCRSGVGAGAVAAYLAEATKARPASDF